MDNIKVSQDELRTFLEGHHFINAAIAKKMGVSEGIVSGCFNHKPNRHGKPLSFSSKNIELLNQALHQIAEELSRCKLKPSNEETASNPFINDDPAVIESLRRIGEYIRLNWLTWNVLGWNQKKCLNNISLNGPKPHVHISKENAERISTTILSIATTLANWEVLADEGSSSSDGDNDKPLKSSAKRKTMESSYEAPKYEWDDTSLGLPERSALLRQRWPNGMLLFRVNGGYTAEGDDAQTVHDLLPDVQPYTDMASGMTTAYMSEEQMTQVLSQFIAQGRRVMITDMYKE